MDIFLKKRVGPLIASILFMASMAVRAGNAAVKDTLGPNEKLMVSELMRSANGQYTLVLQEDGNLVSYDAQAKAIWYSDTFGSGAKECVMQADGNLLLKDRSGRVVWATYTDGHHNAKLRMQNDGNLVIYNPREFAVWVNGRIKDSLSGGERLLAGEFIRSQNRKYTLVMQKDGNLVAYDSQKKAIWESRTAGTGAIECALQSDGNLLLKDANGRHVWATETYGYPDATLLMQDNSLVVLSRGQGAPFWVNGKLDPSVPSETPPADAPAEVGDQNDGGSGRDAGNVLDEAVPIYPVTEPADGELSPADSVDFYSIPLDKVWKLSLGLAIRNDQDFDLALLDSKGKIQASSARGTGQSESLDFLAPAADTYYIRVSRKAGQGRYRIELSFHKQDSAIGDRSNFDANTGDNEFDIELSHLNNVARRDLDDFIGKLSGAFGISRSWIENLLNKDKVHPADAYMIARTASVTKKPIDSVRKAFLANRGQGWGVIAKQLGIKPGSKEFHALKNDDRRWLSKGKGQEKKNKNNPK